MMSDASTSMYIWQLTPGHGQNRNIISYLVFLKIWRLLHVKH